MNINYQFADIIGSVYKNGNTIFMPDGCTVLSPVGNKLRLLQLKENLSRTISVVSNSNITRIALNKSGTHAFIINDCGQCLFINLTTEVLLHTAYLGQGNDIKCIEFSPNGRHIAVSILGAIRIYSVSDFSAGQFNPILLLNQRFLSLELIKSLNWSSDGQLLVSGSEDCIVRIFSAFHQFANIHCCVISRRFPIVETFFYGDEYDVISVEKNGFVALWAAKVKPEQMVIRKRTMEKKTLLEPLMTYSRASCVNLLEQAGATGVFVKASAFNKKTNLLAAGFSHGVFVLCLLPDFSIIHNFRTSDYSINTLSINSTGDWISIGCGYGSQTKLMVWEWQSESYILNQQSHGQRIKAIAYSPDGSLIATGAEDGKVKIWNYYNSFCIVTFEEHQKAISDICFTQNGRALLSASLEGMVRAHDLKRYRNFRSMAAPKNTQLHRLCVDQSGDLVIAASGELFEIYIWSLETGNLLEILTGQSDVISSISCFEDTLAAVSKDATLHLWNIFDSSKTETVQLLNEGVDVKYSPCGQMLAVLCYDSCISLFQSSNYAEIGNIETKMDLDVGREAKEKLKKSTLEKNKSFTCIAFSPDSLLLLAGGQTNTFCLYSVADRLFLRSFKLTTNISLDGVLLDVDYRKFTEFGNINLIDCSDSEADEEEKKSRKKLKLPGTKHSDLSERSLCPSIQVDRIAFNPTGRNFGVVSTEGVSIFSLDVQRRFDPFKLETEINPAQVIQKLNEQKFANALCLALRLNDPQLVRKVVEDCPFKQINSIIKEMDLFYAEKLLKWISGLESGILFKHINFYQVLIRELLYCYGADFKRSLQPNLPAIISIQQALNNQSSLLSKLYDQNKSSIEYLLMARKLSELNTKFE